MSVAFAACLLALFGLAAIGAPIAYAMLLAAIVYLGIKGQDLALAGEQLIQGLYASFIILAVPLFIVAAAIMNARTISERLLGFCAAVVGRFRGGLCHTTLEDLTARDGSYVLRVFRRSDDAVIRAFHLTVENGEVRQHPRAVLGYEPQMDFLLPRVTRHGQSLCGLIEAVWLESR